MRQQSAKQGIVFRRWHDRLAMERRNQAWHEQDLAEEYQELMEATGLVNRWSEYSDVVYCVTRARWGGYNLTSPLSRWRFIYGTVYMFPKYTLRFWFFRQAGKKAGAKRSLHEVRNPKKLHKLDHIAKKYDVDPEQFVAICKKQLRHWPLLK